MAVMVVFLSFNITSLAAKEKVPVVTGKAEGTVLAVQNDSGSGEDSQFVLFVGKEFAGRHFTLKTDAGVAPHAYTVDKDGYIRFYFETGSSSKYELVLLDNQEPTVNSDTLPAVGEKVSESETETEVTTGPIKTDDEKPEEKEGGVGTRLLVLVVVLALLGGAYFFIKVKKTGFKKRNNQKNRVIPFDGREEDS